SDLVQPEPAMAANVGPGTHVTPAPANIARTTEPPGDATTPPSAGSDAESLMLEAVRSVDELFACARKCGRRRGGGEDGDQDSPGGREPSAPWSLECLPSGGHSTVQTDDVRPPDFNSLPALQEMVEFAAAGETATGCAEFHLKLLPGLLGGLQLRMVRHGQR